MCLCVGMCLHVSAGTNLRRPQALDPVELGLQVVVNHLTRGLVTKVFCKSMCNTKPAISPALKYFPLYLLLA